MSNSNTFVFFHKEKSIGITRHATTKKRYFCDTTQCTFGGLNLNNIKYRQKYINTCNLSREHHVYLSKFSYYLGIRSMTQE